MGGIQVTVLNWWVRECPYMSFSKHLKTGAQALHILMPTPRNQFKELDLGLSLSLSGAVPHLSEPKLQLMILFVWKN